MYILFDVGGTNLRIASSKDGETIDQVETVPTPQTYEEGLTTLIELTKQLSDSSVISKIAGGLPGLLNQQKTMLAKSWHLIGWVNKPLADDLAAKLQAPITLENDTALGALGEANFGAGEGFQNVMYISIGTGYGGAWVIDGKLVSGKFGFEPGHQIIDLTNSTELETFVSGSGLTSTLNQSLENTPIADLWEKIASPLSVGIYNSLLHWPSDIIILGGGVILKSNLPLDGLKNRLVEMLNFEPLIPILERGKLGSSAGLYGALTLIR